GGKNRSHRPTRCDANRSGRSLLRKAAGAARQIRGRKSGILRPGANPGRSLPVLRHHRVPRRQRLSRDGAPDDRQRKTPLPTMEKPKKKLKLPAIDSIQKLAKFWDTHDLTDFEDELDEVAEPVFARKSLIVVRLQSGEAEALEEMARIKGISQAELVR